MNDVTNSEVLPLDFNNISSVSNQTFMGNGYEMSSSGSDKTSQDATNNFIIGTSPNWQYYKASKYMPAKNKKWYYRTDGEYKVATGNEVYKNTFDQTLKTSASYLDSKTLGLNCNVNVVKQQFPEERKMINYTHWQK